MNQIELTKIDNLNYGRREAINSLKINMQFAGVDIKTVAITSCGAGEGKSTIAFDLARSLADSGKSVIFIDADMRMSQIVARYKIDDKKQKTYGLTHFLTGQIGIDNIICKTNVQGLYMVLSGPFSKNPTELLSGTKFESLLIEYKKVFDYVIIDTPPLGAVIDAAIIAPKTDGTIIVAKANSTSLRAAKRTLKQLEVADCKVLGFVLNMVSSGGRYYSRNKYYGSQRI